jgi:hypothetical protein
MHALIIALCLMGPPADAPAADATALDSALAGAVVDCLVLQSDVEWHRGDYRRAGRALWLTASFDPSDADAWTGASWLFWSWGAKRAPIAILDRMVEAVPGNSDAFREAGQLVRLQGDEERCLRWMREAHRLAPDDTLASIVLGASLRKHKLWDEAAEAYRSVLLREPGHQTALRFLDRYERTGTMAATPPPAGQGAPDTAAEMPPAGAPGTPPMRSVN